MIVSSPLNAISANPSAAAASPGDVCRLFAAHDLVVAPRGEGSVTPAMPPRAPVILVVGGALGAAVFVDQRLPVGDRDLVVVRMDFAEGEEAVAVAAVIDERGLQRRLDARHFRQIDVAS